jgi:hypothetical protein
MPELSVENPVNNGGITAMDDKMRSLLKQAVACCPDLVAIIWANPDRDEEKIVVWLQSGVPDPQSIRSVSTAINHFW